MTGHSKLAVVAGTSAVALAIVPSLIKVLRRRQGEKDGEKHYEFGGPFGAFSTMWSLPIVIFFLHHACSKDFVVPGINLKKLAEMPLPRQQDLYSRSAFGTEVGWILLQVLLERTLPGKVVEGVDLAPAGGKGKLKYKMNGHLAFWVSMAVAGAFSGRLGFLYDNYSKLAGASVAFSTMLSTYLYWRSFKPGAVLAKGGNSGNAIYDFFIGRELNPRIGSFDLKQFCELRPGLIGWAVLNLAMAVKQFQKTGSVSSSMVLVNLLQGLYVWDALFQEHAILTTMDITTDGFGYMLAFGDLAWVPFTYGLQARYLVDHDPALPAWALMAIAALGFGGYAAFRGSNGEKDAFRTNPEDPRVKHLKVLEVKNRVTGKPSKLIVSSWWGMARKINYSADWTMAISWSLTTGTGSVMTYFYPIYFAILLIHRASRDDHFCSEKYGEGWLQYKKKVPYVFFPGLI